MLPLMIALAEDGICQSIKTNVNGIVAPRPRVNRGPYREGLASVTRPTEESKPKKIPASPNEVNPIRHSVKSLQ